MDKQTSAHPDALKPGIYTLDGQYVGPVPAATPAPKYPEALVERLLAAGGELGEAAGELSVKLDGRSDLQCERERVLSAMKKWVAAVAELPGEADADEALASQIAMTNAPDTFPTDTCGLAAWVLKGIRAGREHADSGRL